MSIDQDERRTRRDADAEERSSRRRSSEGRALRGAGSELPTRSRSYGSVIAGSALVIACGLGGYLALQSAGQTSSVIVMAGPVAEGETIDRSDLMSAEVAGVDGAFAAGDVSEVVGKTAAVDLVEGEVVTGPQVTDEPLPAAGEALVGVSLEPPQVPGDGLDTGDRVRVVGVGSSESSEPVKPKWLGVAQVYRARQDATQTDRYVVTLVVDEADADAVASYAAAGRVSLVEVSAGGGA